MPKLTFLGEKQLVGGWGKKKEFLRVSTENMKKDKKFSSGCESNADDDGDCQGSSMRDCM